MRNKIRDMSLQGKISSIYIVANVLIFVVNLVLLAGINGMSSELDLVYQDNMHLNELVGALSDVQTGMTDYLMSKSSESLEEYYRCEQIYADMINELQDEVTDRSFDRMERNIKFMSESYLEMTVEAVEAKRGRNVEKYRVWYEDATQMYRYINTYISGLNNEQFETNSENYNELSQAFRIFGTVVIVVMIIVIVGNIYIIIKLSGNIIEPLKKLAVQANEVADGNFDIALMEYEAKDEIGVVTRAFNQMVVSIREYIEKVRQSMELERALKEKELMMEAHLKDAQLKYLQAQINPHFLFNTLNAGAQLAMLEGADQTYGYVQNVAEFFRYNVRKGDSLVTVREEIELIDNYIYILNVRFSGEIHYEKEIDESLLSVEMPSMILQPIIENCVNHGIREIMGQGKIWLSLYEEDNRVCISIRDNGAGIPKDKITKIMNGTYHKEGRTAGTNGIGMDNVISRLRLYADSEEVMKILSDGENCGTETIIFLQNR